MWFREATCARLGPRGCALPGFSPGAATPKPTQGLSAAQAGSGSPPSNLSSSCCLRGSASLQGGLLKVTPGNSASSVSTPLPLDSPANLLSQNA